MKKYFKKIWTESPRIRKMIGVTLVIIGVISIITPFTPFAFLLIVGLSILGTKFLFWEKVKDRFKKK